MRFVEIEEPLTELLRAFGPPRKPTPHNPFWYLESDELWVFEGSTYGLAGPTNTPRIGALRESETHAGLPLEDFEALRADPELLASVTRTLLESHFPESYRDDILAAVGLSLEPIDTIHVRRRDPAFRHAVLRAYEHRCAVCELQIIVRGVVEGVEAAHVKWHAARGPDEVANGVALCALHHKALDRGWLGIDERHVLRVSDEVSGNQTFDELVGRFHGRPLRPPRQPEHRVHDDYRDWHWREVFRGVAA
ncbi:MAG: HNH endonuclease [Sandaracinaceae bacterium]|nr:HNH endonuclease [Sandaracinaceae bacterium]